MLKLKTDRKIFSAVFPSLRDLSEKITDYDQVMLHRDDFYHDAMQAHELLELVCGLYESLSICLPLAEHVAGLHPRDSFNFRQFLKKAEKVVL